MIGLPTIGELQDVGRLGVDLRAQVGDQLVDARANHLGQLRLRAGVHHHVRDAAHQVLAEPDLRVHRAARPRARRRSPGRTAAPRPSSSRRRTPRPARGRGTPARRAMIVAPSCTATVAVQSPARSVRCSPVSTWSSHARPVSDQSRSSASSSRSQVARRVAHVGLADLDVVQADDRVDLDRVRVGLLPDDLPVQLALRRHVHHEVADHLRVAAQPSLAAPAPTRSRYVCSGSENGVRWSAPERDPVLRELPLAHDHLAAAADPAPAAHGVEVHAERASRRRAGSSRARTARACPTG